MVAVVDLEGRPDWDRLAQILDDEGVPAGRRAAWVHEALAALAAAEKGLLDGLLERLASEGCLRGEAERFLTLNRFRVPTTRRGVEILARQPDVIRIQVVLPPLVPPPREDVAVPSSLSSRPTAWGPSAVGAPSVWAAGVRGRGRRIALLDGGWDPMHEALRERYEGTSPCGGGSPRPGNHGTAVLSAALGMRPDGTPLGPAPEAAWIAADPFPSGGYEPDAFTRCSDWVLREAPDVVILPWGSGMDSGQEPFGEVFSAWRTAGIFVAVAAGNNGPRAGANLGPANLGGLEPGVAPVFSVGAGRSDGRAYAYSSRGPSRATGGLFPILVAPGADLLAATDAPESYGGVQGTSFAVGVVAGAVVLLRQAAPDLSVPKMEDLLERTARDLGPPGPDGTFGYGMLDVEAAFRTLKRRSPTPR